MLRALNPDARYCYKKALAAREGALETKNPEDRIFYFEAEARWLKLAQGYEFSSRTKQFIASHPNLPQRPSCPACAIVMPLAEVQALAHAVSYRFECTDCGHNTHMAVRND